MGSVLFRIEDSFRDSVCYGRNDTEVLEFFRYALDQGREELETYVQAIASQSQFQDYAFDFRVGFQGSSYVVVPPREIEAIVWEKEYGDLEHPPSPIFRQAVQQARNLTQQIVTENLEWL